MKAVLQSLLPWVKSCQLLPLSFISFLALCSKAAFKREKQENKTHFEELCCTVWGAICPTCTCILFQMPRQHTHEYKNNEVGGFLFYSMLS